MGIRNFYLGFYTFVRQNRLVDKDSNETKKSHYLTIEVQDDKTFINIHIPNTGAYKYIKRTLKHVKGETDRNRVIVGNLNTPHTSIQ